MSVRLGEQLGLADALALPASKTKSVDRFNPLSARAMAWLKLARPRTWSFALCMFVFSYASTGQVSARNMALGILVCCVLIGTTNVFNAWTDRREDAINLPHRGRLIACLGESTLRATFVLGYLVVLIAALMVGRAYALVVSLAVLDSILYSWGVRLKARASLSLLSFSLVVALSFISGWVINEPLSTLSPLLILLTYFFLAYGTIKNFPDAAGDRASGVKTIYSLFGERKAIVIASALLFSPYLLLTSMLAAEILPAKYVVCYLFLPVLFLLVGKKLRDRSVAEREATHVLGFFYQITFFLVTLVVYHFSPAMLGAAVIMFLLCALSDYYQIDSRPYDLRLGSLLSGKRRPATPKEVLVHPSASD